MPLDFVNLASPRLSSWSVSARAISQRASRLYYVSCRGGGGKKLQERVRTEWREKYDPDGTMSKEELRERVRTRTHTAAAQQPQHTAQQAHCHLPTHTPLPSPSLPPAARTGTW